MDVDDLTVPSRWSGKPVYRLAGCSQFYFAHDGLAGESFDRVWTAAAECLESLDEASHWIGPLDTRTRKIGADAAAVRDAIEQGWDDACARFGAVTLRAFSRPDPPRQQLSLSLPRPDSREPWAALVTGDRPSRLVAHPDAAVERTLRHASALRPHVGLVGFGLMSEPWMEPHHAESALPFLERYPGLNLPYRLEWGADGAGIPGVDWLTVLGERPLALAGGIAGLRTRLQDAAEALAVPAPEVLEYPGGAIVRAGQVPQLDDPETGGAPRAYRAVDAALRALRWTGRSPKPGALLKVGGLKGIDPAEATHRWVTRFD